MNGNLCIVLLDSLILYERFHWFSFMLEKCCCFA